MIVTVVGAGGKTTICSRLGEALAHMEKKVLVTTTTHMLPPQNTPLSVGGMETVPPSDGLTAAAKSRTADGKLKGFSGEEIDFLAQKSLFGFIIVEADGARGRPLKAPAAWEPVWPQQTALAVGVIGLDCLGRPLNEECIHRSALFSRLTGAKAGVPVTWDHLLALVRHPDGLFRHAPQGAKKIVFLNKADVLKDPKEAARGFIQKTGLPVFLASCELDWTDAFIRTHILKEGENANG